MKLIQHSPRRSSEWLLSWLVSIEAVRQLWHPLTAPSHLSIPTYHSTMRDVNRWRQCHRPKKSIFKEQSTEANGGKTSFSAPTQAWKWCLLGWTTLTSRFKEIYKTLDLLYMLHLQYVSVNFKTTLKSRETGLIFCSNWTNMVTISGFFVGPETWGRGIWL